MDETDRELLQRRLKSFALLSFSVTLVYYLVGNVILTLTRDQAPLDWLLGPINRYTMPMLGLSAGTFFLCRGAARSSLLLRALDLLVSVGFLTSEAPQALVVKSDFGGGLPETENLLATVAVFLTLRAALVPSSPARTLVIHGLSLVGPAVVGVVLFRRFPRMAETSPPLWAYEFWLGVVLFVTTLVSHIIYGLRREVSAVRKLGQYTLERRLGAGGMGEVYEARHAMLRRKTAIKLLRPDRAGADNVARFEREVQLTAQLTHPNTVAIYDYGRTPDGTFYYAMELLDGVDLQRLVELDGSQPPERVVHVLRQVSSALSEAHAAGLIHRDIKPSNIILCDRGGVHDVAKVVDFGLVKQVSPEHAESALSQIGALTGTPMYLAPEAITRPRDVDARADLYALGAVGFWLLTGTPVFDGKSVVEVCSQHLHELPQAPSQRRGEPVGEDLDALIVRCLAKDPDARPQSAAELVEELSCCRCASPWTVERASSWWKACGERVRPSTPAGATARTIAVDFEQRDQGSGLPRAPDKRWMTW